MNYDELEYNLYTIANCDPNENEKNIKKKIIKLLKFFHPDKNNKLEDKIYNHIILANEILLNIDKRKEYDLYLTEKHKDYNDLKNDFNNQNINYFDYNKDQAIINFNKMNDSLNKYHNYQNYQNNNDILLTDTEYLNNFKKSRDVIFNNIEKINIKNNEDFNKQFDEIKNKINNNIIYNNEVIPINNNNDNTLLLINFNKLYIENNNENNINNSFYL